MFGSVRRAALGLCFRSFTAADLSDARQIGADLRGADLSGAKLDRAQLDNADLTGANLTRLVFGLWIP